MTRSELAQMIDHTLLEPAATGADIRRLCQEARAYGFGAVCVYPCFVQLAVCELKGTLVKVATVVSFPSGAASSRIKAAEAEAAVSDGAQELDLVLNIGAMKAGRFDYVEAEIAAVVQQAGRVPVKVILETCYLSSAEIITACKLAVRAGARFVKTSTGFGPGGARPEQVRLMRQTVGPNIGVKAAGGIKSYAEAMTMIEAGACRIGTSSGVQIITE
ncbi:MAG: deoxyribose-phosphate aldolase [Firmicutes bacterium]|nr:deoxyribose-phosphate aldolase [Bacillota bacterium]